MACAVRDVLLMNFEERVVRRRRAEAVALEVALEQQVRVVASHECREAIAEGEQRLGERRLVRVCPLIARPRIEENSAAEGPIRGTLGGPSAN